MVIGPFPPPQGGVANFVNNTSKQDVFRSQCQMTIARTGRKNGVPAAIQPILEAGRFMAFLVRDERKNAELVHIHSSAYWSFLRILPYVFTVRRFSKAKLLIHVHSGEFKRFYFGVPGPLRSLIRSTLRSADQLIVTSPSWISVIREIDGNLSMVTSLTNGFDPERFHPISKLDARRSLGLPADKKILLTVGYMEKVKGHQYLIEAMANVLKHRNDVILIIIGIGSLQEQLMDLTNELHLGENVRFIKSGKTPDEIALWMNAADVFVLPSLNEGNPTVMFECLGCGRPMVGTRVGGVPDVITSDGVGLLCNPADPAGLADCMISALYKPWDEDHISKYAQQFTWENITLNLLEIYKQTLGLDDSSVHPQR